MIDVSRLINISYANNNSVPIVCTLVGSRAYQLDDEQSDSDFIALHLENSEHCLQHPSFKKDCQVIQKTYSLGLIETPKEQAKISIDSFEFWKFITLITKGSFSVYELLYMPPAYARVDFIPLLDLCRCALTSKIAEAAIGLANKNCCDKNKTTNKKAIMAYFRLLQALIFLRENTFEWKADLVFDYHKQRAAQDLLLKYKTNRSTRRLMVDNPDVFIEINEIIKLVQVAQTQSTLPAAPPQDTLLAILDALLNVRITQVKGESYSGIVLDT